MKLVFLSNYYNHHQKPTSDAWFALTDGAYRFVATEDFSQERKQLGWEMDETVPFLVESNQTEERELLHMIDHAEAVVIGSAPFSLINARLSQKKLVFQYSERIFKQGYNRWKWLPRCIRYWQRYGRYKSLYLLSSSAYTTADYAMHGIFRGKSYKWGYFPRTMRYDIQELQSRKNRKKILWCGRFLDWKHPDDAIEVARRLSADGYDFEMDLIGTGDLEEALRRQIQACGLSDKVRLLGSMKPDVVRAYMEAAGIYLFTSDFEEGWGAVLNESMNSGCAVVASHAIGAVPFLMKHEENGLIYVSGDVDGLYRKVKWLLDHPEDQQRLGEKAYNTIVDQWNAETAAARFLRLAEEIRDHGYCDLFEDGPCSPAKVIKNNWFKEGSQTCRFG